MSEKKGKISLSGLGKGSSSSSSLNQFPSFRFSPENEEIHEIMMEEPVTDDQSESLPDSPKPGTGGDVSPLKEYILKHKWANWEKRSLSLDLDLKGKIITAIEDKRKSIVSHFIPEETGGSISSSQSVNEHIGMVTSGEESSSLPHSISNSNGNPSSNSTSNWMTGSNSSIASTSSQGGNNGKQGQSNPNSEIAELSAADEFEEIGVDYIAAVADNGSEDDAFFGDLSFVIPAEDLCEHIGGIPQLYQPTCLNLSSMPTESSTNSFSVDSLSTISAQSEVPSEEDFQDLLPSPSSSPSYEQLPDAEDLRVSALAKSMFQAVCDHWFSRVLVVMFAISVVIPSGLLQGMYCFILGVFTSIVIYQSWTDCSQIPESGAQGIYKTPAPVEVPTFISDNQAGLHLARELSVRQNLKSQGWMTELEGEYDPLTCHLRMTRIVFVRLDGASLFISYPHPRYRIPKRRMWSDSPIASEMIFVRHDIYTISGAKVSIAPEKLARKRAWNKKYPIRIDFPNNSVQVKISPSHAHANEDHAASGLESSNAAANNAHTNSPTKDKIHSQSKKDKKDIHKEDCSHKTLYLFNRTDREKDDWFRRFKAASHLNLDENRVVDEDHEEYVNEQHLLRLYRDYMARVIPSKKSSDKTRPTEKFENMSIAFGSGIDKVTISKGNEKNVSGKEKSSPSSSKKSTPDKEKHNKDDFTDFGIENISSIPQSPAFLNAILGRIFFDFLGSPYWKDQVKSLITKKLFYIKKPPFLGELKVAELDMGCAIPVIHRASSPVTNSLGMWVDLDLTYDGRMIVTLETHINLFKLRKTTSDDDAPGTSGAHHGADVTRTPEKGDHHAHVSHPNPDTMMGLAFNSSNIYDSEADDSGESSESDLDADELLASHQVDDKPTAQPEANQKGGKIMRLAERLASSKYMKTKVVKKVVGNLGNTPLILAIELVSLAGTLAVNIPNPPTDRIWIGFRGNPNIEMSTKPKVGDRKVSFVHVSKWIQRKLILEFQRVMVIPNMNDISIPLMEFKLPA